MKFLRWFGFVILGLICILLIFAGWVYFVSQKKIEKIYSIHSLSIRIPTSQKAIQRGHHLVHAVLGCMACHSRDLAGRILINVPIVGRIVPKNLTSGKGGIGGKFTTKDWVMAIRNGVSPNGKSLLLMPSLSFSYLSKKDLGDVIAYLKSIPPVNRSLPANKVGPIFRFVIAKGGSDLLSAEAVNQHQKPLHSGKKGTAAEGYYLVHIAGCMHCHGPNLAGGTVPDGAPPGTPPAANLTPAGIGTWTKKDFIHLMRTGETPGGASINNFMPWEVFKNMTNSELKSIWLYLKTIPPVQSSSSKKS
ncbi:MAG: cytochrome c [Candidatus Eremiobacteraeota bacterium]|nr:cytochrome c [Candidatus Eremiobacteraeota bacterium]